MPPSAKLRSVSVLTRKLPVCALLEKMYAPQIPRWAKTFLPPPPPNFLRGQQTDVSKPLMMNGSSAHLKIEIPGEEKCGNGINFSSGK